MRNEIVSLIAAAKNNDVPRIINNRLSPMFKGKILSTYYPEKYLNIFAKRHLDYFLDKLGLVDQNSIHLDEVEKRNELVGFKNSDRVMKDWSLYEFTGFLYSKYGRPLKTEEREEIPEELKEYIELELPLLEKVEANFINLVIDELGEEEKPGRPTRTIDFEKENRINKELGDRGELVVLKKEKEYLESVGRRDLSGRIKHISVKDNSAGYDILSFNEKGIEKYIEVKSTRSRVAYINFIMSSNELEKARNLENYYVYVVFEANSLNPKIWSVRKPFDLPDNKVKIVPLSYRVRVNLRKED